MKKHGLILLCSTVFLLCSCGPRLTCNLHELVTPPDARVAMVDKMFPHRSMKSTDCFEDPVYVETGSWGQTQDEYLYRLNGVLYQKRTIQYAKANRPIIRRNDVPESPALTATEMQEQFTIDPDIPEEVWMQPVWIDGERPEYNEYACIPAKQFDFAKARKIRKLDTVFPLCRLPIKDKAGTETPLRLAAGAPLMAIDVAAGLLFFVTENALLITAELISFPIEHSINIAQQQQRQQTGPAWQPAQ